MPTLLHPVIGGMFTIPTRLLRGPRHLRELEAELTTEYFNVQTGVTQAVRMYRYSGPSKRYIHVPRAWARDNLPELWAVALDRTVKPIRQPGTYPKQITPRNEQQAQFMSAITDKLRSAIDDNVIIDLQINAMTGTGKTVAAIKSTSDEQLAPILVIVHQNRVKEQWRGSIALKKGYRFFFGEEWTGENVGIVQQDVCDYEGRAVVVAMGPSLISRTYPQAFYDHFGVVIVDELHKFATPMLNLCLGLFRAAVKVGMTATEKKGKMGKVPKAHLGPPAIISTQKALQPTVVRILNVMPVQWGKHLDNANSLRTMLGKSKLRNELLTQIIFQRGYSNGRQCLVLSDRVDQLLTLKKKLVNECGVPEEDIGLYVGAYPTGRYKASAQLRCNADDSVVRRLTRSPEFKTKKLALKYAEKWTEREDIMQARDELRSVGLGGQFVLEAKEAMHKPTAEDYDHIEKTCSVVLATYGIFDVAIDISRLDWGLEATPRSDVEQAVGRCLRIDDGKPAPVWNTIEDRITTFIEEEVFDKTVIQQYIFQTPKRLAKSRRTSYSNQNATYKRIKDPYEALEIATD